MSGKNCIQQLISDLPKITNTAQIGGVETAVLDNGAARGVRVAYFNTGGGLRFKVVIDRAMDIAEASLLETNFAWISKRGIVAPETCRGMNWLARFGGGLLTTCGLAHVGPPETNARGEFCLHGDISNIPAQVVRVVKPSRENGFEIALEGEVLQSTVFGAHLLLRRRISTHLLSRRIEVEDEITNIGNTPAPNMVLYHCNLGYPLIDEGAKLEWRGTATPANPSDSVMGGGRDFTVCRAPLAEHAGAKESVAFIDPIPDADGICTCAATNAKIGKGLKISFPKKVLPHLINWQHWGAGEYVCALEPATNPPIGQANAEAQGTLRMLAPDESAKYRLCFEAFEI